MAEFTKKDNVIDFKTFKQSQDLQKLFESNEKDFFDNLMNFFKDRGVQENTLPYKKADIYTSAIYKNAKIGFGMIVEVDSNLFHKHSEIISINPSNFDKKKLNIIAKYKAFIKAVELTSKLSIAAETIAFYTDSKFLADLLHFKKKVQDPQFLALYEDLECATEELNENVSNYVRINIPSKTGTWGISYSYSKNPQAMLLAKTALNKSLQIKIIK